MTDTDTVVSFNEHQAPAFKIRPSFTDGAWDGGYIRDDTGTRVIFISGPVIPPPKPSRWRRFWRHVVGGFTLGRYAFIEVPETPSLHPHE